MDVIQSSNKHVDMFGPGLHGFEGGSPSGTPATFVTPEWCNMIQQELVNIVLRAGGTLNPASRTQVADAVQALIAGATGNDYKASVRVATTTAINLAAPGASIDGAVMVDGDRFLDKDNATPALRGIYIWNGAAVPATRAVDADGAGELSPGTLVAVEEGTAQADTLWMLSTDGPITIGTTDIQFVRRDSGAANTSQLASGSAVPSANTLVLTLDPSTTDFRSATLTSGARVSVTNSSPISLVVPETATLGLLNGVAACLAVLEINYAGTKEVAVVNLAGGVNLDETQLISTVAMSTGSDSANVIYSQTARASVAFRVRMLVYMTQATAGVYASNPTLVQPVGGQAGAAMQSLGYGQTWQSVSRANGTTYYNTTGKPIFVSANDTPGPNLSGYQTLQIVVNSVLAAYSRQYLNADTGANFVSTVVPVGASYSVSISGSYTALAVQELR